MLEVIMWRQITGWLFVGLLSVVVPPPVAAASPPPSPQLSMVSSDPEVLDLGRRLFAQNCSPCHGKNAVGEDPEKPLGDWKEGVGPLAPALNGTGHAWHHPPSYHLQIIRRGSTLQGSRMIGWDTRMSDFDIIAVIAYFQSLWPPHLKAAYQRQYLYRVEE
jgi:mono/diheme cytochrome c family protein